VIPRYQRILFWILSAGILLMTLFLLRGCEQAHKRLTATEPSAPLAAPTTAATEDVTLYLANDAEGSITSATQPLALPQEPTRRARAILQHLFIEYSLPASAHRLPSGPAVDDVFLLNRAANRDDVLTQEAVVNLRGAFLSTHPSGIEVEDLTIQSIIGTLHAAFPQVAQIRFLVDGQSRDTLNGHANLQRVYPATDTSDKPTPPNPDATK
jgi:hypothetical protein